MEFEKCLLDKQKRVNERLKELVSNLDAPQIIIDSMKYSLLAGGKRIRPILSIAICEALGGNTEEVLDVACSIEMIHTYSLIHDDLPCMDNDDYRRGKLTNHKVYGEAIAILTGDALLNLAFEILLLSSKNSYDKRFIDAAFEISRASGVMGMIAGQVIDITNVGKLLNENLLKNMHEKKTGKLIEASCNVGAIIANRYDALPLTREYSKNLGIAFQIVDDILDVVGNSEKLGKSVGKDAKNNKPTFVSLYGLEKSRELAKEYSLKAAELAIKIDNTGFLHALTEYLLYRES
ncbi:geranylgeranyl diphosphate synthase, type II [Caloramator fervidus]|uniref:Farnesyl diphosphate synthase n=1 Tax=Caloramator fervidus TaxID=29344 RepID=A0A1H5V6M9_9CLOT|nr:farnesyl diphosphate synthase [Caloramator fervidus]SEF82391.1 geranylgeranyl diphosphate synthase, type II [Caloramator fervidus]